MRDWTKNSKVRILAAFCVAMLSVGCTEKTDEAEQELLTEWDRIVQRIAAAKPTARKSSSRICKQVSDGTNGDQCKRIVRKFSEMLHSIDISSLGLCEQLCSIDMAFDASYSLARVPSKLTDRERWQILLEALAWERSQFVRIVHTDRGTFENRNSSWNGQTRHISDASMKDMLFMRFPEHIDKPNDQRLQYTLDDISNGLKQNGYVRRNILRRLVADVEDDRYSEETRAWVRAEMERIIGRPLTDDDIMFKDDVLRRRKARGRKQGQEPAPRGCPPTTRLNPQPLSGAWCLVSDAVC